MPTEQCRASIQDVLECFFSTAADKGIAAFVGITASLPLWHSYLKDASEIATLLLPWVGLAVGGLQFHVKTLEARERRRRLAHAEDDDGSDL